jgi:hypothetical protein
LQKSRPTTDPTTDDFWCHYDSVLSTPISHTREQAKYDSDDELSSLVSEPGSPQDFSMVSDDEAMVGDFDESPPEPSSAKQQQQQQRMRRIATPMIIPPPSPARPRQFVTGAKQHFRQRHQPREYVNASTHDFLDVPSPIDENDVPTPPPCPAETAESQLSMLSVTDVDMDADENLPSISVASVRSTHDFDDAATSPQHADEMTDDFESAIDFEPMDHSPHELIVRKQRQRSGALSGADSPARAGPSSTTSKRGFSMGFRADCEKCRLQVPGHMNHFLS